MTNKRRLELFTALQSIEDSTIEDIKATGILGIHSDNPFLGMTAADLDIKDIPIEQVKHTRKRVVSPNPFDDAVLESYEMKKGKIVKISYAGVSTLKRSGEETGVDKNVAYATSLIRKAAGARKLGVKMVYVYNADHCVIHFAVVDKRRRRDAE